MFIVTEYAALSHITKQLLTSTSVEIRIYLPLKVILTFSGR